MNTPIDQTSSQYQEAALSPEKAEDDVLATSKNEAHADAVEREQLAVDDELLETQKKQSVEPEVKLYGDTTAAQRSDATLDNSPVLQQANTGEEGNTAQQNSNIHKGSHGVNLVDDQTLADTDTQQFVNIETDQVDTYARAEQGQLDLDYFVSSDSSDHADVGTSDTDATPQQNGFGTSESPGSQSEFLNTVQQTIENSAPQSGGGSSTATASAPTQSTDPMAPEAAAIDSNGETQVGSENQSSEEAIENSESSETEAGLQNGAEPTTASSENIVPANRAPVAVDNAASTNEDAAFNGTITGASDVDGDSLTYALDSGPSNGVLILNADGSYTYTPNADYNGADSFSYTVSDGNGGTSTATVNLTISSDGITEGTDGADTLVGTNGIDILQAGNGDDRIYGGQGDDSLSGGEGQDVAVYSGTQADYVVTEDQGVYTVTGPDGTDILSGIETLEFDDGSVAIADAIAPEITEEINSEDLFDNITPDVSGTNNSDSLSGGNAADVIDGGHGDDTLAGGASDDTIVGGTGNDVISGEADSDTLSGDKGADELYGGAADDVLYGGTGSDTLDGGADNDILYGDAAFDEAVTVRNFTDDFSSSDGFTYSDDALGGEGDGHDITGAINNGVGTVSIYNRDTDGRDTSGGFERTITVDNPGSGSLTFSYRLEFNNMEANDGEYGELIVAIDGQEISVMKENASHSSNDDFDGGWQTVTVDIGSLSAGNHTLAVGLSGQTDNSDENVSLSLDDMSLDITSTEAAGTDTLFGGSGDDSLYGGAAGDVLYGGADNDLIQGDNTDTATKTVTVINEDFSDSDTFSYSDDALGGDGASHLIDGSISGGSASIRLAGNVNDESTSAGFQTTFNVDDAGSGKLTFTYELSFERIDEAEGEYGEVVVAIDGHEISIHRENADVSWEDNYESGSRTVTIDIGDLSAGSHDLSIGMIGQTDKSDEVVEVSFDNLTLDITTEGGSADSLYGDAGDDTLLGAGGDDYIYGGADDDILKGGYGADTLDGGSGDDTLVGGAGDDFLSGGENNDLFDLSGGGNDVASGGTGWDTIALDGAETFVQNGGDTAARGEWTVEFDEGGFAFDGNYQDLLDNSAGTITLLDTMETISFDGMEKFDF